ncbi:MAG: hypothetical protein L3K23_10400 [Thermoplasmata archaeon]|nr:hypothetical protein [Thermoplasmata archaeon]
MARAVCRKVTARKNSRCSVGGEAIHAGDPKFVVTSFRRRTDFCVLHEPTPEQVRGMAPQSRADRASTAAGEWTSTAEELRSIAEDAREAIGDDKTPEDMVTDFSDLKARVEGLSIDESIKEELADEMRTWADNLDSGNLGHTSKHDEVEQAADEVEGIDLPSLPSFPEPATKESVEGFADECEECAGELDDAASSLEGVDFPTAF